MHPREIWDKLMKAEKDNEPDDFRHWIEEFAKALPNETFQSIERRLRQKNSRGRILALRREIPPHKCLIDLQGNTGKKYVAQIVLSDSPGRIPHTTGIKAESEQGNYEWLADAGFMVDDPTPFCLNCKIKGHLSKDCKEQKGLVERTTPLPNRNNNYNYTKRNDAQRADSNYRDDFNDRNGYRGEKEVYNGSSNYEQSRGTYNNNYSSRSDTQNYNYPSYNGNRERGEYYSPQNERGNRRDTRENNRKYSETDPYSNDDFSSSERTRNSPDESRGRSIATKEVFSSSSPPDIDNVKTWW